MKKIRVAVNGYGVIGKRIADSVNLQDDMELVGVSDVGNDWRIKVAIAKMYRIFSSSYGSRTRVTTAQNSVVARTTKAGV